MTKWLSDSGLRVNEEKTMWVQYKSNTIRITRIQVKQTLNVLGIIFDAKMCWAPQVSNALRKGKKALNAIKLTKIL
jgi:hypothetical protein